MTREEPDKRWVRRSMRNESLYDEAGVQNGRVLEIMRSHDRSPSSPARRRRFAAGAQAPWRWHSRASARAGRALAAGDPWLIALTEKATRDWQEHVDGKPQYSPPILPLAPARFTGSLWLVGSKAIAECTNYSASLQKSTTPSISDRRLDCEERFCAI
jgi:hypothetical protein